MKISVYPIITVIAFSLQGLFAQSKISGFVKDEDGNAISQANVSLLKLKDSSVIKEIASSNAGFFAFNNIAAGRYIITGTFIGFKQAYSTPISTSKSAGHINSGTLTLSKQTAQLNKVTVTGKKQMFEQQIDRMVINVSSSITAPGSTVLEVLERSPGIVVDRQNNTLSMNGKNGVVIMINGKISRVPVSSVMQMLAGMSAGNIEKIELITTPPANYDAEGNAGFINIVLKNNPQFGTNGSYSATAGYGRGFVSAASVNFNYRREKVNLYGDCSFSRIPYSQDITFYRKVLNQGTAIENYLSTNRDAQRTFIDARMGVDYELSKKTIVGALISGYDSRWTMNAQNNTDIFLNQKLDTVLKITNHELHDLYNYGANLNVQHNFSADEKLILNIDYVHYKDHNPTDYLNSYFNGTGDFLYNRKTKSGKETPITFWVENADYSKKLGKKLTMEAGIKATFSTFTNDVGVDREKDNRWVTDNSLTAKYSLKERITAAYTTFNITINDKMSAKVGARYEYTNSNLGTASLKNIVDRHYGNLFPSFFLSNKISEKNSINFSYSRRITRPTFNDMAPFVYFVDPNTFFSGNPALQPSIADAVKTDYIFKKWVFSLSYSFEARPITNFSPKVDPATNTQTLAAENQKNKKTAALTLSLPITINNRWKMQFNFIGTWQQLNAIYKNDPFVIEQKYFNLNTSQTINLPKDYSLELSGYYITPTVFSVYLVEGFGSVNFGMQKKLKENKGTLRFAISDVLGPPHYKLSINQPTQNLAVKGDLQFVRTTFKLTFTHSFGNDKVKERRSRPTGSEEEKQRVNANN
ncbi:MAG: hypothetical protein JWQ40_4738 [Segetibacter sp.]|nr:hypothetical protein [Segetibacter sp.]